jgi:hypothetical protein
LFFEYKKHRKRFKYIFKCQCNRVHVIENNEENLPVANANDVVALIVMEVPRTVEIPVATKIQAANVILVVVEVSASMEVSTNMRVFIQNNHPTSNR